MLVPLLLLRRLLPWISPSQGMNAVTIALLLGIGVGCNWKTLIVAPIVLCCFFLLPLSAKILPDMHRVWIWDILARSPVFRVVGNLPRVGHRRVFSCRHA